METEILSCRTSGTLHACLNKMGERMTNYGKLAHVSTILFLYWHSQALGQRHGSSTSNNRMLVRD